MKNILFLFLFLISSNIAAQTVFTLSHPVSGAVYQRNASGNAEVFFCGQANRTSAYYIDFRLHTLNKFGTIVSSTSWENGIRTVSSSNQRIFRFSKTLSTGWYRAEINVRNSGGVQTDSYNVWFGVGEVFIIAGQSNALGEGSETYGISGLDNLQCVVSGKTMLNYYSPDIVNVGYPYISQLNSTYPNIAPNGTRTWFYQKLGNDIANNATAGKVTPVMFFNVAVSGSSIYNWKSGLLRTKEMFSNNYNNNINTSAGSSIDLSKFPKDSPWGDDMTQNGIFTRLKTVLSFYGNMFGVRAVLWHQGEAETHTLINTRLPGSYYSFKTPVNPNPYSVESYRGMLEEIINESRVILPGVKWAISKVSMMTEKHDTTSTDHYNILSNALRPAPNNNKSWLWSNPAVLSHSMTPAQIGTNNSNANVIKQQELTVSNNLSHVTWFITDSDSYNVSSAKRQSDNVHFNSAGLVDLANDAYSNIISNVLSLSPVLPTAPPQLSISHSGGSNYTSSVAAPSGVTYSKYQWEYHFGGLSWNDFNQSTSTTTNSFTSDISTGGWVKDNIGRIHLIPFASYIHTGMRKTADSSTTKVYPNPIAEGSHINVDYISDEDEKVTVEFYSEDGKLLENYSGLNAIQGLNTFSIKVPSFLKESFYPNRYAYMHVVSKNKIDKVRLLIK